MKKGLKKRLLTLSTSLTLLTSGCSEQSKTEFETYKGTRNLIDYQDFLEEQGINYRNCYAQANGNDIIIYEKTKTYGTHIVSQDETIDDIINIYNMDKLDFMELNKITEDNQLNEGDKVKINFCKSYYFSLEDLDTTSKWEYYVIMPGDTLSEISDYYNITVEEIQKDNNIQDPNSIQAYTTIKIIKQEKEKTLN